MVALKYQHIAILKILGHVTGSCKRRIWVDMLKQDRAIKRLVMRWTKAVLRMRWKNTED